jgi:hypothetical protein
MKRLTQKELKEKLTLENEKHGFCVWCKHKRGKTWVLDFSEFFKTGKFYIAGNENNYDIHIVENKSEYSAREFQIKKK